MSNTITATITGVSLFVAERNDAGLICRTLVNERRPATFADADTALAFASLRRIEDWELNTDGLVEASVAPIDNRFNSTVAARLDQAVGTTHGKFEYDQAKTMENGDLISDGELMEIYVVARSSLGVDETAIHMVGEGQTWEDRHTGVFLSQQLVKVARKR